MYNPKEAVWEALRQEAVNEMAKIYPEIARLRKELHILEDRHGRWQARCIEAEQHLVEVVKVKPARTQKAETALIKAVGNLSSDQRQELLETLQTLLEDKAGE